MVLCRQGSPVRLKMRGGTGGSSLSDSDPTVAVEEASISLLCPSQQTCSLSIWGGHELPCLPPRSALWRLVGRVGRKCTRYQEGGRGKL